MKGISIATLGFGAAVFCGVGVGAKAAAPTNVDKSNRSVGRGSVIHAATEANHAERSESANGPSRYFERFATMGSDGSQTVTAGPSSGCYGSCCDVDAGTCVDGVQVYECAGFFQADGSCAESSCPPVGACCDPLASQCVDDVPLPDCPDFQYDWYQGTSCSFVECLPPPVGACCENSKGTCQEGVTIETCIFSGPDPWWFQGLSCADIGCPISGACCNSFEAQCDENQTIDGCFSSGGDSFYIGAACEEIVCPVVGACCDSIAGICTDDVDAGSCFGGGGDWYQETACNDVTCPTVGACCAPEGCIDDQTLLTCGNGVFYGGFSCAIVERFFGCPTFGACCAPDNSCEEGTLQFSCEELQGGDWFASQSCNQIECPPLGACCDGPSCTDNATRTECTGNGGFWLLGRNCADSPCEEGTSCGGLNQGFETGDFNGWIAEDLPAPYYPLSVEGTGIITYSCFFETQPSEGSVAAVHGWDGAGPGIISLAQDMELNPGTTVLSFDYRAAWLLNVFGASLDRTFAATLFLVGGGNPLVDSQLVLTAPAGTAEPDTLNQTFSMDVSAYTGSSIRIVFEWFVPENFTGPAQFQLDNVRCGAPPLTPADHANFAGCMTGPGSTTPPQGCSQAEFELADALTNGRVDLRDFRVLSLKFAP